VGISLFRYKQEVCACETKSFRVDGVDGRMETDTFLFNDPRTMDWMVVVINETDDNSKLACSYDCKVLGLLSNSSLLAGPAFPACLPHRSVAARAYGCKDRDPLEPRLGIPGCCANVVCC
jgi:hypothetical protein